MRYMFSRIKTNDWLVLLHFLVHEVRNWKQIKVPIYLQFRVSNICRKYLKIVDMIDFNGGIFCRRTFSLIQKADLLSHA